MTTRKMNLPLPSEMHRQLFREARDEGVPATRLVRTVLRRWLDERMRAREANELTIFAEQYAGTDLDLIPVAACDLHSAFD